MKNILLLLAALAILLIGLAAGSILTEGKHPAPAPSPLVQPQPVPMPFPQPDVQEPLLAYDPASDTFFLLSQALEKLVSGKEFNSHWATRKQAAWHVTTFVPRRPGVDPHIRRMDGGGNMIHWQLHGGKWRLGDTGSVGKIEALPPEK